MVDQNQRCADEWALLQHQRQEIAERIENLKRRINGFSENPFASQMLAMKSQLAQSAKDLQKCIREYSYSISQRAAMAKNCQSVLMGLDFKADLDKIRDKFLRDMGKTRPREMSHIMQSLMADFAKTVGISVFSAAQYFLMRNTQDARSLDQAKKLKEDVAEQINCVRHQCRQAKTCLEENLKKAKFALQKHRDKELAWGGQNPEHISWMIANQPLYREDLLRYCKHRFPESAIAELFGVNKEVFPPQNGHTAIGKKRRLFSHPLPQIPASNGHANPKIWKFWITFDIGNQGKELPIDEKGFVKEFTDLTAAKADLRDLDGRLVHKKLHNVTRMTLQQQRQIKQIIEDRLHGWQSIRIGHWRLLICIEHISATIGHIRFIPKRRNESYLKNH